MAETFFYRPRSMVWAIDLVDNRLSAVWGETEWISHVLINPVDPDTVVFCHEGGSFAQHRLWIVDARPIRKKRAEPLHEEAYEEFLVHEYFLGDGTLGVQRSLMPRDNAKLKTVPYVYNSVLFLDMNGKRVAEYELPGRRSGHVQSSSDNSLLVADGYFPDPDMEQESGRRFLALQHPRDGRLDVEKLCRTDTSWKTQLSHPHPTFSPDDRFVVFSSDRGGANGAYVADLTSRRCRG
jgi:oligogalacturonide lyase